MRVLLCLTLLLSSCDFQPTAEQPFPSLQKQAGIGFVGSFPRFPHNTVTHTVRSTMVFYSPDDLFSNITWDFIGYPADGLFKIHQVFPLLKTTVQAVPENRYLGEIPNRNILKDPVASDIWKRLGTQDEFKSWLEFGNHGYFHSPEGDPDLDHHEFNPRDNPLALDSGFCYGTFARARATYAAVGLDNDRITVMRFPGYGKTDMALQALVDGDFLAFFERRDSGHERWMTLKGNRSILSIPDFSSSDLFDDPELIAGIKAGKITSSNLKDSEAYRRTLTAAMDHMDGLVASGGVINFFDHWWEHSRFEPKEVNYRFPLFIDVLEGLREKYGSGIWWGFGGELARWSHLRDHGKALVRKVSGGVEIDFRVPGKWKPAWALEAGYTLTSTGTSGFPDIRAIYYTLASEGHAAKHPLEGKWWIDGDRLHFNVMVGEDTRVTVELAGEA